MPTEKPSRFRLTLTNRQQEEIRAATGRTVEVLDLTIEELEDRITPGQNLN